MTRSSPISSKVARTLPSPQTDARAPHERIVAVARDMFCRDGIHATGVDRILAAANASKMTLYSRFGSKEALVRTALREEGVAWRAGFSERVMASGDDAAGRLRGIVPALTEWFRSGRFYGCAFINAVAEHTKGETWVRELALEHQAACRGFFAGLLEEAGHAAPEDMARQIVLTIDGTVAGLMCSGDEAVLDAAARTLDVLLSVGDRASA